ncbi:TRAP transporter small permease [Leucothrix arctica]|uniref:TRAP transporter small permease protein n=1 Tax=Leucothrix arctica TaxID=1481894 RepID=A0A317C409_9GAMM|nr:TRAP transporter small permease [Leucothrix arctica]PWQ93385.1 TRAP transporter small permease [Leucothrix arctica]
MKFTQTLYRISAVLSAMFLAGIGLLILAQIVSRLVGSQIPSADDFAAWSMAGSVFLALPATFNANGHIRVTILFKAFGPNVTRVLDVISTLVAIGILAWGTWFVGEYVFESYIYHDVSQGIVAVPLWIPQCAMFVGILLMTIALIEHLITLLKGGETFPDEDVTEEVK